MISETTQALRQARPPLLPCFHGNRCQDCQLCVRTVCCTSHTSTVPCGSHVDDYALHQEQLILSSEPLITVALALHVCCQEVLAGQDSPSTDVSQTLTVACGAHDFQGACAAEFLQEDHSALDSCKMHGPVYAGGCSGCLGAAVGAWCFAPSLHRWPPMSYVPPLLLAACCATNGVLSGCRSARHGAHEPALLTGCRCVI